LVLFKEKTMKFIVGYRRLWLVVLAAAALLLLNTTAALAHERRMVGPYEFVVGFSVEPAFEGQKNGVDLRVRIPGAAEGDAPTQIEGVNETLEVEVTHVASGVSQVMRLRAIFNDPGHYTNDWIPTAAGPYRFRFFGTVEDLAVDETFESGPETFGSVEAADTLYFPEALPQLREVEGAVRGAQETAAEAANTATEAQEGIGTATTLAVVGIVLGLVGTAAGIGALVTARRRV
jgi:hypothetical protein